MPIDPKLLTDATKAAASQWMPAKLPLVEKRLLPTSDGKGGATHWKASPQAPKMRPIMTPVPQKKAAQVKSAGPVSEALSSFNPLNMYGGSHVAGLAALAMPTRSLARQAEYDSSDNFGRALGNVLIPGMGPYNAFKRLGASIRSPEMKALKNKRQADKLQRELGMSGMPQDSAPEKKEEAPGENKSAGWKSEYAGMLLNPLSLFGGNMVGGAAAGFTPTRTLDEQAGADDEIMSNLLIPGRGAYNYMKRIGAATRSPEMLHLRNKAKQKKLEKLRAQAAPPAAEAPAKAAAWAKLSLAEKAARVYEAAESVDNMPIKETRKSHKKCAPGEFGMNKEGESSLGGSGAWWSHPTSYTPNLTDLIAPALGAGAGALGGAAVGKKGKKLKSALIGAGVGGAAGGAAELALPGLGLGLKYTGQDTARALAELLGGKKRNIIDRFRDHDARQHEMYWHYHNRGLPTNNFMYSYVPPGVKALGKAGSAHAPTGSDERFYFGCKVAFEIPESVRNMFNPQHQAGQMTLGGAALGGLGGMAAGALGAGKGKRMRGALGGALAGALGGGAAGAGANYFAPEQSKQMLNYLQQMYANQTGGKALPSGSADDYANLYPDAMGSGAPTPAAPTA